MLVLGWLGLNDELRVSRFESYSFCCRLKSYLSDVSVEDRTDERRENIFGNFPDGGWVLVCHGALTVFANSVC